MWILEAPVLPTRSAKPARWMVIAGALAGALVLGLVGVALAEASSRYARTPEGAARAVGASEVAILPRLGGRR